MHDFYIVICVWLTKLMSTNQFYSQKTFFQLLDGTPTQIDCEKFNV